MWSSDRRGVMLGVVGLALTALAACGYQPVEAPGGPASGLGGQIQVAAPLDEKQYAFVQEAEARLGPPPRRPRYRLDYTITSDEVPIGTTPDQVTTRYNVIGKIDWTLLTLDTGAVATSGGFQTFTSYAATGSPVTTLSASEDAYTRLLTLMADQIVDKLTATAADWAQ